MTCGRETRCMEYRDDVQVIERIEAYTVLHVKSMISPGANLNDASVSILGFLSFFASFSRTARSFACLEQISTQENENIR